MKILVTGGTGFIGSHLVRALVKQGDSVFCLARNKKKAHSLNLSKVSLVKGDIRDKRAVERAIKGMDVIYHLAAISGKVAISPALYQAVNIEGTRNIIEACLKAKVKRLVHTSTVAVTGKLDKIPGDENSPYRPGNWYEKSKTEGEKLVLEAVRRGLPAVVVRPGLIYGPGHEGVSMAKFFKMAAKGFAVIPGNGKNLWDITYIDDCLQGFLLAGKKKAALGEVFIINGSKPITVNELLKTLAREAGMELRLLHLPVWPMRFVGKIFGLVENVLHLPMPFSGQTVQLLTQSRPHSNEKAKRILGYHPRVSLKEGIAKTVAWYREIGFITPAASRGSKFRPEAPPHRRRGSTAP